MVGTLFPDQMLRPITEHWCASKDGDVAAMDLFRRHYTFKEYRDGRPRRLFVGPGEKMVLLTAKADALFVWRKFISGDGQKGVNCSVFRNEGSVQSSLLITEAMAAAWDRWPGERLYTYVNGRRVKSANPGYCFIAAGWRRCGITKWNKLIILEAKRREEDDKNKSMEITTQQTPRPLKVLERGLPGRYQLIKTKRTINFLSSSGYYIPPCEITDSEMLDTTTGETYPEGTYTFEGSTESSKEEGR